MKKFFIFLLKHMFEMSGKYIPLANEIFGVINKTVSSTPAVFHESFSVSEDLSLILLNNNQPYVVNGFEVKDGYLPFTIKANALEARKIKHIAGIKPPFRVNISGGAEQKEEKVDIESNIREVLATLAKTNGFEPYTKSLSVTVTAGANILKIDAEYLVLNALHSFGSADNKQDVEQTNKKLSLFVKSLQEIPAIQDNFEIYDTVYASKDKHNLYPMVFLIPKAIARYIEDFLINMYKQKYPNLNFTELSVENKFEADESVGENENVQKFLEKLPLDLIAQTVIGKYGDQPAVLLPNGNNYEQYLAGTNAKLVNTPEGTIVVFGNIANVISNTAPQHNAVQNTTPQPAESQTNPAPQQQFENEKILNIELAPYIPDWLKPYLNKYGIKEGETLSRKEREEFAEKVWSELQKNWNKIIELLEMSNVVLIPTTTLALVAKFPSEYKASTKKIRYEEGNVIEETTRSLLSNVFAELRQNYLIPLLDSVAPDQVLDLRVLRPMSVDEFDEYQKKLIDIIKLYKSAYTVFSFVNLFKKKATEEVTNINNLNQMPDNGKYYLKDVTESADNLMRRGFIIPLIVDADNTLIAPSRDVLRPDAQYTAIKLNDFRINNLREEQLKELKQLVDFSKKAFDDQYGVLIVKTTINPSALDMDAFKVIVKLLGICEEGDEICIYKARQELSAFPESLKEKFVDNLAKETGRNPKYRIQLLNMFATLFALLNYYEYINSLKEQEIKGLGAKLLQQEEEKAKKLLETVKQGLRITE